MRQEIQTRMDDAIAFSRIQNTVFDLIVGIIDESIAETTYNGRTEFYVTDSDMRYAIQSSEDIYENRGSIFVYIDDTVTNARYANLTVDTKTGDVSEDYFTMPRAKRNAIFALFGDIIDAVDEYINSATNDE